MLRIELRCAGAKGSSAPNAPLALWIGCVLRRAHQNVAKIEWIFQYKTRTRPGEAAKALAGKKIPRLEGAVSVQVRPPAPLRLLFGDSGRSSGRVTQMV
jgi:hypothetical protein